MIKKHPPLPCSITESVVVFDGAIITGLLAPKEVWKKRLKQRLFSQTTTTRSLLQRSTFTSSTSAFPLVVEERRARIASHNRIRCALLSIVFGTPFLARGKIVVSDKAIEAVGTRKCLYRATASFSANGANLKSIVTGTARATML